LGTIHGVFIGVDERIGSLLDAHTLSIVRNQILATVVRESLARPIIYQPIRPQNLQKSTIFFFSFLLAQIENSIAGK
jgi:hypothetical protein